jgi:hypothetical protein
VIVRIIAVLASAWIGWRWIGFLVGIVRIRSFEGPVRREARRVVVARGAINVFLSVVLLYVWAALEHAQPSNAFVGFLAAMLMCSLFVGVASAFMQPQERTPETFDVCRVLRR